MQYKCPWEGNSWDAVGPLDTMGPTGTKMLVRMWWDGHDN